MLVGGQRTFLGVGYLLFLCGLWGSNSGHQAFMTSALPVELFCWSSNLLFKRSLWEKHTKVGSDGVGVISATLEAEAGESKIQNLAEGKLVRPCFRKSAKRIVDNDE